MMPPPAGRPYGDYGGGREDRRGGHAQGYGGNRYGGPPGGPPRQHGGQPQGRMAPSKGGGRRNENSFYGKGKAGPKPAWDNERR